MCRMCYHRQLADGYLLLVAAHCNAVCSLASCPVYDHEIMTMAPSPATSIGVIDAIPKAAAA